MYPEKVLQMVSPGKPQLANVIWYALERVCDYKYTNALPVIIISKKEDNMQIYEYVCLSQECQIKLIKSLRTSEATELAE